MSARIDGHALDLVAGPLDLDTALASAVGRAAGDGRLRLPRPTGIKVVADDRALDRLLVRLSEAAADGFSPERPGEIAIRAEFRGATIGWPWRASAQSGSLLGGDFSFRLAQRLATVLGGTLVTEPGRLTLHLPAAFNEEMQATTH